MHNLCRVAVLAIAAVLLSAAFGAHAAGQEPRVLVLHSYHKGYRWTDNIMAGIEDAIATSGLDVEMAVEYMDTKRHDPSAVFPALVEIYRQKYVLDRPSVIIASDDNAFTFLMVYREKLFAGVPVIFCGINNLNNYQLIDLRGYTGVAENFDLKSTLDVALELHPGTTHAALISDDTPSSRISREVFMGLAKKYRGRVSFIDLYDVSRDELIDALAGLPENTVILHNNFFRDRLGRSFSYKESIRLVAQNTDKPMYSAWDWYLGHGVVGGMMISGQKQGQTAADMAIDVLQGRPVEDIPVLTESPNEYMFDFEQLARFGILQSALPEGSVVINQPQTFYWRYKYYIWGTAAAFIFLSAVIAALTVNIAVRRRAENELRAIFDNSLVGILYLKGGRTVAKVNNRIRDILGYAKGELTGKDAEIMHLSRDNYEEFGAKYYEKLANREVIQLEYPLRHKDGHTVWCQLSGKALFPPNLSRGVIWVLDDITERKRMDEALKSARDELERRVEERTRALQQANTRLKSEMNERDRAQKLLDESEKKYHKNLEAIFGSLPESIVTVDKDMRIIEANKSFQSVCGLKREDLHGKSLPDALSACTGPCMDVLRHTLETKAAVRERRVECIEGDRPGQVMVLSTAPFLDHTGLFSGAVLVIRDISRLVELEQKLQESHRYRNLVGRSEKMRELFSLLKNLADYDATVLILGESGTGKDLAAEALHYGGPNKDKPFIKVNCSALSESLLESELFGHVRGSFTGAYKDKIGRFEAAEGGTVFLDEIGDISPKIQLKLLRFLESKEFERVGESATHKANVRLIAATNIDLFEKVGRGEFREDLYYRLKVMVVNIPPLRERKSDLKPLVEFFVGYYAKHMGKNIETLDDRTMSILMQHDWPGNVRELKHAVEHACIVCEGGVIRPEHLPSDLRDGLEKPRIVTVAPTPRRAERTRPLNHEHILEVLAQAKWNKTRAAEILGISRRHLYRKMHQYGIQ